MVGIECLEPLFKSAEGLVVADHGDADADSVLLRAGGRERDGRYAVAYEFVLKLAAGHVLVSCGEEEAVGYWLVAVD